MKKQELETDDMDTLLPQPALVGLWDRFWARYHLRFHASVETNDFLISKGAKKLGRRLLTDDNV